MVLGKLDIHMQKNKFKPLSQLYVKVTMKKTINVRAKTIKFIEENKGEKLCNDQVTIVLI